MNFNPQHDPDEFHGMGGAYIRDEDGKRRQVEKPTVDHPDGNGARDAKGKLLVFKDAEAEKKAKEAEADASAPTTAASKAPKADVKGAGK